MAGRLAGCGIGSSRRSRTRSAGPRSRRVLLLDSNENVYGPSAKIVAAAQESLERANHYPHREYGAHTEDIAGLHRIKTNQILLGCGSTDLLRVAATALLAPGKKAVTASPTYEDLAMYSKAIGAEIVTVPLTSTFSHDLDAMLARVDSATALVYICNPNNPTASITPRADIETFLSRLPPSVYVMIDEAYHHYANPSTRYVSFLDNPAGNNNVIVLRTFSKIYGMAGLRLGYAVADAALVEKMRPFSPMLT